MPVQANEYIVRDRVITARYLHSPRFGWIVTYTPEAGIPRTFFGRAVQVLDAGIGTLITVTLEMSVDNGGTDFSVLLPFVELAKAGSKQAFNTDAIVTHFKGPDSVPPIGVRDTYDFIPMTGTADFIFIPAEESGKVAKAG